MGINESNYPLSQFKETQTTDWFRRAAAAWKYIIKSRVTFHVIAKYKTRVFFNQHSCSSADTSVI